MKPIEPLIFPSGLIRFDWIIALFVTTGFIGPESQAIYSYLLKSLKIFNCPWESLVLDSVCLLFVLKYLFLINVFIYPLIKEFISLTTNGIAINSIPFPSIIPLLGIGEGNLERGRDITCYFIDMIMCIFKKLINLIQLIDMSMSFSKFLILLLNLLIL